MEEALKYIKERIDELEKAMSETNDKQFKKTYEDMIESFETVQAELEACVGETSEREKANESSPHDIKSWRFCPHCGTEWTHDCEQFGCWQCGTTRVL